MIASKRNLAVLMLLILISILQACPLGDQQCPDPKACDQLAAYIDPAVVVIAGGIDDQIGSAFALHSTLKYASVLDLLSKIRPIDDAWADICGRPSTVNCINEARSISYSDCPIGTTSFVLNGTVTLAYSGSQNCGFSVVGDSVTRTMNVMRSIPENGIVATSSNSNIDFRGNAIGGGTRLTIAGINTYSLDLLGLHKALTITIGNTGHTSYDLLMRTTSPFIITGGLTRGNRVINDGTLEVITPNNFVYTLVAQNLTYSTECCYPVSGTLLFTETGPVSGSGSIVFSRCGSAHVERNGNFTPYDVSLVSCE